jgi:hypothetical protein
MGFTLNTKEGIMPYWCENDLTITGPKEVLERFRQKAKHVHEDGREEVLSFEPFLPMPCELKDVVVTIGSGRYTEREDENGEMLKEPVDEQALVGKYGAADWCDWSLQNWGTCDACDSEEAEACGDDKLLYRLLTVCSPPAPVIFEMSRQFPELEFELRYFGVFNPFHGILCCQGGDVTLQECRLNVRPRNNRCQQGTSHTLKPMV